MGDETGLALVVNYIVLELQLCKIISLFYDKVLTKDSFTND